MNIQFHADKNTFQFKKFLIGQGKSSMKVNTDGILLGAWTDISQSHRVLDIGTGTGVIALILKQKNPSLKIDAIDIDENAYEQALENFSVNELGKNIKVYLVSLQDYSKQKLIENSYDLIVSNPPFFSGGTFSYNENKANVRHTIKLGHGDLLQGVRQLLKKDGVFSLILPYSEGLRFIQFAEKYGLFLVGKTNVYSRQNKNIERLLLKFSYTKQSSIFEESLVIMKENTEEYTNEFKELTKELYLHL